MANVLPLPLRRAELRRPRTRTRYSHYQLLTSPKRINTPSSLLLFARSRLFTLETGNDVGPQRMLRLLRRVLVTRGEWSMQRSLCLAMEEHRGAMILPSASYQESAPRVWTLGKPESAVPVLPYRLSSHICSLTLGIFPTHPTPPPIRLLHSREGAT